MLPIAMIEAAGLTQRAVRGARATDRTVPPVHKQAREREQPRQRRPWRPLAPAAPAVRGR